MRFDVDIESAQQAKSQGDSIFLSLKDGESVTGVLRGDVKADWVDWSSGKPVPTAKDQPGAKFKFRVNFIATQNGALTPKLFSQGTQVYKKLKALSQEYDLERTIVKITRVGSDKKTQYEVMPTKEWKVSDELEAKLLALKLLPLEPTAASFLD